MRAAQRMSSSDSVEDRPRILPRGWHPLLRLAFTVSPGGTIHALGWLLRGKRIRGWNQLYRIAADHPDYYRCWIRHGEPHHLRTFLDQPGAAGSSPTIACLILGSDRADAVALTAASVLVAFGGTVTVWTNAPSGMATVTGTMDDSRSLEALLDRLDPSITWLLPLRPGDVVSAMLGRVLDHAKPDASTTPIVFWDEDKLRDGHRVEPWLKPHWDPVMARVRNPLNGAALIAVEALRTQAAADLALRCDAAGVAAAVQRVAHAHSTAPRHLPLILTSIGVAPSKHGARDRGEFEVGVPDDPPQWPSVTIIIPTRDRADLLAACLDGLDRLVYAGDTELIVVDNDSVDTRTHDLFERLERTGARVLRYPGKFNFAAMINRAAASAKGDMLCLLNNDVEPLDGTWLTAMVRYASSDHIGAVGARLLYPDGTIQHVGVAAGVGDAAGHVQKGVNPADLRFADWHSHSRIVSAVTAACLTIRRCVFEAADGMDADIFAIDFNDVDLCWRLQRMGFSNVVAVQATLLHRESQTRSAARSSDAEARFDCELAQLRARWDTRNVEDPHHHPMFRRASERCLLAF